MANFLASVKKLTGFSVSYHLKRLRLELHIIVSNCKHSWECYEYIGIFDSKLEHTCFREVEMLSDYNGAIASEKNLSQTENKIRPLEKLAS